MEAPQMRASRFIALTVALAFVASGPSFIVGQTNWTPSAQGEDGAQRAKESSPLNGVSVKMIALSPKEAQKHYSINIQKKQKFDIQKKQKFVVVQHVGRDDSAVWIPTGDESTARYGRGGYGLIQVGDLIDTVILGGEIPEHGQVRTITDFHRFASLCIPGCLVFVRHKDNGNMSDITKQGEVSPKFFSRDGLHACDRKSGYVYPIHFDPRPSYASENWIPPQDDSGFCNATVTAGASGTGQAQSNQP